MTKQDACCTCATLLTETKVPYDPTSEKALLYTRHLACCSRFICATCQYTNPRFQTYCPFCQISSGPSALPKEGLRLPPSYSKADRSTSSSTNPNPNTSPDHPDSPPPSYTSSTTSTSTPIISTPQPTTSDSDVIHYITHDHETLPSLSLLYSTPLPILRRHNNLYSDALFPARKSILIPKTHYTGPALSTPPDPAEEARKTTLRRWMVATKCAEYDVAVLYLKGADYDLDIAVRAYRDDEEWERNNPLREGGKRRRRGLGSGRAGGSLAAQIS